ncbi:hypothetical protein, partial [Burkholderia stagnalis]
EWGYDRAEIRTFLLSPRDGSKDAIIYPVVILRDIETDIVIDLSYGQFSSTTPRRFIIAPLNAWRQIVSTLHNIEEVQSPH